MLGTPVSGGPQGQGREQSQQWQGSIGLKYTAGQVELIYNLVKGTVERVLGGGSVA